MRGVHPFRRPYRVRVRPYVYGFSLLELMVVIGIVAILALVALPGVPDKFVRDQIVDAVKLADVAKTPVALSWALTATLPVDNAAAGLPAANQIVNNYISSVAVESGAIQVTFGNHANANIQGKILTFRPGVVPGAPVVPVAWVCGNAEAPGNMTAMGLNKTSLALKFLPLNCRSSGAASTAGT
jgi:type IV pilus assembly protein PilA